MNDHLIKVSAPRSQEIPKEDMRFASKKEELESSVTTLRGLLHYHQRMSMVSDPSYMADFYEIALRCAIACLEEKLSQLEMNKKKLPTERERELSTEDCENIKTIRRSVMKRWISVKEKTPDPKQYEWVLVSYIVEPEGIRGCPSVAEYRDGKWFDWGGDMEETPETRVTHWMPLPLDPEDQLLVSYDGDVGVSKAQRRINSHATRKKLVRLIERNFTSCLMNKKKLPTERERELSTEDCIRVLKNIKERSDIYDAAYSLYGKEYIEQLKRLESSAIDKVIFMLQTKGDPNGKARLQ